jgi:hypothetical protein
VFIDHLNSPYGVVLVGNDLYVADTDAILRFPYVAGETQITSPRVKLTDFVSNDAKTHGRPVGVTLDHTGALLIADDVGNTVWRVSAAAPPAATAAPPR